MPFLSGTTSKRARHLPKPPHFPASNPSKFGQGIYKVPLLFPLTGTSVCPNRFVRELIFPRFFLSLPITVFRKDHPQKRSAGATFFAPPVNPINCFASSLLICLGSSHLIACPSFLEREIRISAQTRMTRTRIAPLSGTRRPRRPSLRPCLSPR